MSAETEQGMTAALHLDVGLLLLQLLAWGSERIGASESAFTELCVSHSPYDPG